MTYVRFYEKNPTVKQAVTNLFLFPADIRSVMAKGMCAIAESDFNAHIRINDLKSLGKEKVLALYKSQEKRRDYDGDPYLSKAMNYLMILEPHDQFFMAVKVNDLVQIVGEFMDLCEVYAQKVQLAIVERITGIYVQGGFHEAQDLMTVIQGKFQKYFSKAPPKAVPTVTPKSASATVAASLSSPGRQLSSDFMQPAKLDRSGEAITDQGSGMRIRLDT